MAYFFFGTLMDPDVLALVLGRRLGDHDRLAAALDHHRTVRAAAKAYPVLAPERGAVTRGRVLLRPTRRDDRRIVWFEEDEYAARWCSVRLASGPSIRARVFFGLDALGRTEVPWEYGRWCREEKAGYLLRCAEWLRDLPP
ncbi:MAG TPA: gamma-glutamylcyclotransferase family protein [Geminicoccaceae bacterium]